MALKKIQIRLWPMEFRNYQEMAYHHLVCAALLILSALLIGAEAAPSKRTTVSKYMDKINHSFNVIYFDNNKKRHEFVFNTTNTLTDAKFSIGSNKTIYSKCLGYHACHMIDGEFSEGYTLDIDKLPSNQEGEQILGYYKSVKSDTVKNGPLEIAKDDECSRGRSINIYTYCKTHWHPPMHLHTSKCRETFEWHSPFGCSDPTVLNHQETDCYTYNPSGELINLIPLIKSDGSGYKVDTSKYANIRNLYINVCNEANNNCGPGVSSCFTANENGTVESGYSNSTSILWNTIQEAPEITYLGQHNAACGADQKTKTIVRFNCPTEIAPISKPKLVYSSPCESIIEWNTLYSCPESNTTAKATDCSLRLDHYGINVSILDLTNHLEEVDVSGLKINGSDWTMKLGICKGLSNFPCGGKQLSTEAACLIPQGEEKLAQNNSKIVGSIIQSSIRLTDGTIIMEYPTSETCYSGNEAYAAIDSQQRAQKLSTKIEFYCDTSVDDSKVKPKFIGFHDCTYLFSWPSKQLCSEISFHEECSVKVSDDVSIDLTDLYRSPEDEPWKARAPSKKQGPIDVSLNVCGLLHGKDFKNRCAQTSSICYGDSNNKNQSLGIYHNATYNHTTGNIELLYLGGELFNSTSTRVSSLVQLVCATLDEGPIISNFNAGSLYEFTWKTPIACNKSIGVSDISRPSPEQIEKPSVKPKESSEHSPISENEGQKNVHEHKNHEEATQTNHTYPTGNELHEKTTIEANNINNGHQGDNHHEGSQPIQASSIHPVKHDLSSDKEVNRFHKIIMISLILMSFISCVVIIVYLNAKTRLTRPLNHFRSSRNQQTPSVPYRRVVEEYGENGDL